MKFGKTIEDASKLTQDANNRLVTDAEKTAWNGKANIADIPTKVGQLQNDKNYVTQSDLGNAGYGDMTKGVYDTNNNGIVDNAEKVNGFTVEANVPANAKFTDTITTVNGKTGVITKTDITALGIPAQDTTYNTVTTTTNGLMIATDKVKLNGIESGANKYTHPTTAGNKHIPTGGTVGQILKNTASGTATWADETDTITTINGKTGAITKADIVALGIPASDTNTTYAEITTAEIDAGTSSTLRTITARRLKYLSDKIVALFPTNVSELINDSGFLTSVTKSDVGLSNVDNVKQMPISGGVLENYREKLVTLSGTSTTINLSLGNVFTHSLTGNTTYTISNAVSGQAHSFTLIVNMGSTVRTLTFPASVKWQGGEIPDMTTASKTYVLTFMTIDGGTNWLGMFGGEF